jgi:hypothetical protein
LISVLGLPLDHAKELLAAQGITVSAEEARSKKGVHDGTEARVIRQTMTDETHATLVYSVFRTEPVQTNS